MPLAITIECAGDIVRLSQKTSSDPWAKTNYIALPATLALEVKAWFASPTASFISSNVTVEILDAGTRIMQTVNVAGANEKRPIILTPAQFATIKAWFALYGGTTAPESPLTVNP